MKHEEELGTFIEREKALALSTTLKTIRKLIRRNRYPEKMYHPNLSHFKLKYISITKPYLIIIRFNFSSTFS